MAYANDATALSHSTHVAERIARGGANATHTTVSHTTWDQFAKVNLKRQRGSSILLSPDEEHIITRYSIIMTPTLTSYPYLSDGDWVLVCQAFAERHSTEDEYAWRASDLRVALHQRVSSGLLNIEEFPRTPDLPDYPANL